MGGGRGWAADRTLGAGAGVARPSFVVGDRGQREPKEHRPSVGRPCTAESFEGYSSQRTANSVTLRVPAEHFRETLDALGELGDVLSLSWDAQDVTDEFNDIEVRLANARAMRERLELLLTRAESVSDALAIERELQRITLEIERFEGMRRGMADRISFSTIVMNSSRLPTQVVPGDEYRLPFGWLNQLGVERLLAL